MKRPKTIASYADILVLAAVVVLFVPLHSKLLILNSHFSIQNSPLPDKVIVYQERQLSQDSLQHCLQYLEEERREMQYYLRVHNIDDDGFALVARYNASLEQEYRLTQQRLQQQLRRQASPDSKNGLLQQRSRGQVSPALIKHIAAKDRPMIAVCTNGGYWRGGVYYLGKPRHGKALLRDYRGRIVSAFFDADTIAHAIRIDAQGIYQGQMDKSLLACGQGVMDEWDGCHKEGFWLDDVQHGFGFDSSPQHQLRIGEYRNGRYIGERMKYTAQRIYGIDISRHQHEKGRHRYGINWRQLQITSFGQRHDIEGRTFPVSFVYIKATEGTTVRNRYFTADYQQARKHGIKAGAYHFFSLSSSAADQARYFLRYATLRPGDFPPVLDVEPAESQIRKIGGDEELMKRVRQWLQIVEQRTGQRPILYVSQSFIRNHMKDAQDIKQRYNVWIARYSQYRPDVKLLFWQLCPDGKVDGITGPVDINVFNGYQGQFEEFKRTGFLQ